MNDRNDIESEKTEEEENAGRIDDEWDRRILCSDGACIGIIGPDGRCKECGKPYEGTLPEPPPDEGHAAPAGESFDAAATEEETADSGETDADADGRPAQESDADSDDEWENRRLCSDGACIGVIGSDGRCKECGKPYEGE